MAAGDKLTQVTNSASLAACYKTCQGQATCLSFAFKLAATTCDPYNKAVNTGTTKFTASTGYVCHTWVDACDTAAGATAWTVPAAVDLTNFDASNTIGTAKAVTVAAVTNSMAQ